MTNTEAAKVLQRMRTDWPLPLAPDESKALDHAIAALSVDEAGNWIAADDVQRLTKQLDVALNGAGGAERPSLCDVVGQVCAEVRKRGVPLLSVDEAKERERFEAWFKAADKDTSTDRLENQAYESVFVHVLWVAWLARARGE